MAPMTASPIPFVTLDDAHYGEVVQVSPLIRRVIARNPSKYTYLGTGTYIVGHGDVAVVDPGPTIDAHRDALAAALRDERVRTIVVTHCHGDHSPLAAWLHATTGAPTVAFGPHGAVDDEPDEPDPQDVAPDGPAEAPDPHDEPKETLDLAFEPDVRVADGSVAAAGPGYTLRAVHTPGHTSNHMCYALDEEGALFTGDHIMGWSTTIVSPPDGDMRAYIESLRKVQGRADAVLWPTHGAPVTDPAPFLQAYLDHRLQREAQVLEMVRGGVTKIVDIVDVLYVDVKPELHKPARRSVLAHLVKLVADGQVACDTERPRVRSHYTPV
jgi:glyoxylase-like metal-dependent hydrolase (beta-lactamase superfamily II)